MMDRSMRYDIGPIPEEGAHGVTPPSLETAPSSTVSIPVCAPLTVILPPADPDTIPRGHSMDLLAVAMEDIPPPKPDFSAPPPYELTQTKLPTYEEVEIEKTRQAEIAARATQRPGMAFLTIDQDLNTPDRDALLGTDFMFFTAFLVAFVFNWIGFLLLMCFCHTIASRYGALSGFGLSLAKWTLIVKHSTDLASHENSWLWWLIMAFGLLICMRAIIQYINIKRGWRMLSGTAQERLLFFY